MKQLQLLSKVTSSALVVWLFASVVSYGKHDRQVQEFLDEPARGFYEYYQTHFRPWPGDKLAAKRAASRSHRVAGREMATDRNRV